MAVAAVAASATVKAHNTPASDNPHTDSAHTVAAVAVVADAEEDAKDAEVGAHTVPPAAATMQPNVTAAVPVPVVPVPAAEGEEEQAVAEVHPQETTYTASCTSVAENVRGYKARSSRSRVSKDRSDDGDAEDEAEGVGSLGRAGSKDKAPYIPVEPGRGRGRAVEEVGKNTYTEVRILAGYVRVRMMLLQRRQRLD